MKKEINITDANGKEFSFNIKDITDMNTDLDSSLEKMSLDGAKKYSMENYVVPIVDSEGKAFDISKLTDKENTAVMPNAIDVLFEATHSGQNRNYFIYHSDSMENDAQSWKTPFAKPFLKNHDSYSEPLGRVKDYLYAKSEFNPDRDCINVTYRITDKDAIPKFLDHRYSTMSIGGNIGHISCGICGKDILKDSVFKFCGHMNGETYAGQKAFWHGRDIQYKEGSVVNMPADDWAQVKKITVVTDSVGAKDGETMSDPVTIIKDEETAIPPVIVVTDILDDIDALSNEAKVVVTDENTENTDPVEVIEDEAIVTDTENTVIEETLEEVKLQRDTLKTDSEKLSIDNLALEDKIKVLELEVSKLNDSVTTITEEKNVTEDESKASRQQAIKFAVMNKKLMAQRVVDFELLSNTLTDAKKDERLNELISKPAKELSSMVETLVDTTIKETRRIAAKVDNPSGANANDPNVITDESKDNTDNTKIETKAVLTMKDLEDSLIKVMTRR